MKNKLIVFTGPSGVGKATIENVLFNDADLRLKLAVSATTRKPRKGEVDGVHYFFINKEEFDKKIENHEFIEWNEHFSNKYGTLKSEIARIQEDGNQPFLEIETFGARNVMQKYDKEQLISIFITPPSVEELKKRIMNRGTETHEQIEERMAKVEEEISQLRYFDYVVVNNSIEQAAEDIKKIILKEEA